MDSRRHDSTPRPPRRPVDAGARRPAASRRRYEGRPLPRIIYIRRRVAAVVVLLALVAAVIWVMTFFGHQSDESSQQAAVTTTVDTPTPTVAATPSPSAAAPGDDTTHTPPASATQRDDKATSQALTPAPTTTVVVDKPTKNTCALADLVLTAGSAKPAYGPGEQPKFFMTVHNPTTADCVIDLDKNLLRFEVYDLATNKRVWSDVDCNPSEAAGTVTFPAGKDTYYEALWSRLDSAPGQCDNRKPVPAGGYYLHTLIGDNHSDAHTFNLS